MIKCEVIIKYFTLEKFDELKNITRANIDEKGKLFKGDTFECDEKMAEYLAGCNPLNTVAVKIIEVKEEKKDNFKLDDNGNVNIEINTILDGKKIAESIRLTAKTLDEVKEEDTLTKKQSKEYKATKKKTSKK